MASITIHVGGEDFNGEAQVVVVDRFGVLVEPWFPDLLSAADYVRQLADGWLDRVIPADAELGLENRNNLGVEVACDAGDGNVLIRSEEGLRWLADHNRGREFPKVEAWGRAAANPLESR
jgi:hypothetical protein